jgi:hypothetical protein
MDAYDRCTNLQKLLPIVLPSMIEAENFSDHPLNYFVDQTIVLKGYF